MNYNKQTSSDLVSKLSTTISVMAVELTKNCFNSFSKNQDLVRISRTSHKSLIRAYDIGEKYYKAFREEGMEKQSPAS